MVKSTSWVLTNKCPYTSNWRLLRRLIVASLCYTCMQYIWLCFVSRSFHKETEWLEHGHYLIFCLDRAAKLSPHFSLWRGSYNEAICWKSKDFVTRFNFAFKLRDFSILFSIFMEVTDRDDKSVTVNESFAPHIKTWRRSGRAAVSQSHRRDSTSLT